MWKLCPPHTSFNDILTDNKGVNGSVHPLSHEKELKRFLCCVTLNQFQSGANILKCYKKYCNNQSIKMNI